MTQTFTPERGYWPCPKCGGMTEICLNARDANGWLIGPYRGMTCDYCGAEGQVRKLPGNLIPPVRAQDIQEVDYGAFEQARRQVQGVCAEDGENASGAVHTEGQEELSII